MAGWARDQTASGLRTKGTCKRNVCYGRKRVVVTSSKRINPNFVVLRPVDTHFWGKSYPTPARTAEKMLGLQPTRRKSTLRDPLFPSNEG